MAAHAASFFRSQTRPVAKGPPVPRARKRLPPKKTDGVSPKRRRRHCFLVPREGACTCYPPALGEAKVASADATQKPEGGNPMTQPHTPGPWHVEQNEDRVVIRSGGGTEICE